MSRFVCPKFGSYIACTAVHSALLVLNTSSHREVLSTKQILSSEERITII